MSQYTYLNLHDKLLYWEHLRCMRWRYKWSFQKMADYYGLSEPRIRSQYKEALKVAKWNKHSPLWRMLVRYTQNEPASYAVRLYGLLLRNNVGSVPQLLSTPLDTIVSIKGIGDRYARTVRKIRTQLIEEGHHGT